MKGRLIAGLMVAFVAISNVANASGHEEDSVNLAAAKKEFLEHHIQDSYDFTLYHYNGDNGESKYVSFPLPVILFDDGLKIFMSSAFEHGHKVAEVDGSYYMVHHGKIYRTDADGALHFKKEEVVDGDTIVHEYTEYPLAHSAGHDVNDHSLEHSGGSAIEGAVITNVKPFDISITKNVVFIMIVFLIMFLMFTRAASHYKKGPMPKKMGRFLEPVILYIRDDIAIPNIGKAKYKRFMPYLLTVFFFVWIVNLFGLTPLGVNVTNSIAVTAFLAIFTFLITTFSGNKHYWGHIFWMPGVPIWLKPILAAIEFLGIFIKPFSLMIRLYANITAGHIVLGSILLMVFTVQNYIGGGLSFVLAFILGLLELLVAALQAYIFTMLSALYFGAAVEEHHHAEEAH